MSRTLTAVPSVLLLALLTACGGGEDDEAGGAGAGSPSASEDAGSTGPSTEPGTGSTDPSPSDAAPTSDGSSAPAGGTPEVEVLDEGAEPRVAFVIDVEVGDVETSVMTVEQEIDAGQVVDVPAIEITLTNEVVSVGEAIELRTTYDDVRVLDPGAPGATQVEQAVSSIEGVTGTTVVSPRGETVDAEFDIPDDVDPAFRATLEQLQGQASSLTVPFPEVELGLGASWRAGSQSTLAGVTTRQTTTYEVTSLEGDRYELSVSVDQEVLPGTVEGAEIVGGTGATDGTASGTAGSLAPERAESSGTTTVVLEADGQRQEVSTTTTTTIETTDG